MAKFTNGLAILGEVIACLTTGTVMAQQTGDAQDVQLVEILVTAQRRTENLQQTPVAVTALSPELLEERSVQTTQDLMQVVPGLQVSTQTAGDNGGSATFFLRGMGQQRAFAGSEPAVGIYIDDIYYPSLEGSIFNVLDFSQIEVLRGPQGTLFGRNTIGGAIRYTTTAPSDELGGEITGTFGSYGRNDATGWINVPISQVVDARLTLGRLQTSGYVTQQDGGVPAGGMDTDLARLQVLVKPLDTLTIALSAQYNHQYLDGFAYVEPASQFAPGPLFPSWYNANPTHANDLYDVQNNASHCDYCQPGTGASREYSNTRDQMGSVIVTWNLSDTLTLKSISGMTRVANRDRFSLAGGPQEGIFNGSLDRSTLSKSQELQVNDRAFDDKLNVIGGLYYYHEGDLAYPDSYQVLALPPPIPGIPLQFVGLPTFQQTPYGERQTNSYAVYFNSTFKLTDRLSLLSGFRWSEDYKDVRQDQSPSANAHFASDTWRAGLQYQWTPDLMSYASVSTGFRAGGFNPPNNTGAPYVKFFPENDRSYEIGMRMEFLNHRLVLNPTAFYNKWSDIQVQEAVLAAGNVVVDLQNAGLAHTFGFELEGQALVTRHLTLFGNLATLSAHYDSVGGALGIITVNSELQRAPRLTYATGATYKTELGAWGTLNTTLNWGWEASQWSTPTDSDHQVLPSYGILNVRVAYSSPGPVSHWKLALFASNLLNEYYFNGGVNYAANIGTEHYDVGRPREFGGSIQYKF